MVKLTKEETYTLFEALSMSYGFYVDSNRQNEAERMKHLMDLFLFVKSADVELAPGDGDDGSNVRKINELLKQRQERLEKKEAGNVLAFPGRPGPEE